MAIPLRVLLVEDSDVDAELVVLELRRGDYDPTYERVQTADAMTAALLDRQWDVVIADYSMPAFSAPEALKLLQASGLDLPFIIVSGTIGEDLAVSAMKAGSHDYIMKGQLKRLVPSIERELREAAVRREHRQVEAQFRQSEERLRMAIDAARMYTWDWDLQTNRMIRTGHHALVYGSDVSAADSSYPSFLKTVHPEDRGKVEQAADLAFQGKASYHVDFRIVRPSGEIRWLETQGQSYRDGSGKVVRMIGITQDITERKQAEALIQRMAYYDTLTTLPNRNALRERLRNAISPDQNAGTPFALLLMDLNHFREINDTLGHHRGDLVLTEVGKRLRDAVSEPGVVARLGGDEFAVLLPGLPQAGDIKAVVDRIHRVLHPPIVIEGLPIAVEASVGVVLCPDHGQDPDTLLQRADVAMYAAKSTGGSHTVYHQRYDPHSTGRLSLMAELRQAIEKHDFTLHYQPKVDLKSGRVSGAEALVRWMHPRRGVIHPDQFIGPAERSGLIHPLTLWVLQAALRQCGAWRESGLTIPLSVNLSARNLFDPELPDKITQLLRDHAVASDCLLLEITESAIMADPSRAREILSKIHAIGVRISIDDFGIGYSSLSYLRRLPVDGLKVDKSFVTHMIQNHGDAVIVRSTIDLGHNLGLEVVAEGVENRETYDRLVGLGCDAAQGYYMGKPLTNTEFDRWLHESRWGFNDA